MEEHSKRKSKQDKKNKRDVYRKAWCKKLKP